MKSYLAVVFFIFTMVSCAKNDPSPEKNTNSLNFVDTKWRSDDNIANILYGGENFRELRFTTKSKFEILEIRKGSTHGLYTG